MKELLKAKSEFRQKGVTLLADKTKSGGGGSWKFAGEDNFIKVIQQPLSECGLEFVATMDYLSELGVNTVKATLYHLESGESISSVISLPEVTPRKDKNGNAMYLDAEIERGKQFGYWSRILGIRILGLSDIDPEDMNNRPEQLSKSYGTWSKTNEQEKLVYKKEFMEICESNGVNRDDIKDFFDFVSPGMDEKATFNEIVHFLRKQDLMVEQIEAYVKWKEKQA